MSDTKTEKTETSWRDKTLKTAGVGYLLGDLSGIAASMARGEFKSSWATAGGYATWVLGGLGAATYGNPDAEKQLEILAHKLEKFMVTHGARVTVADHDRMDLLRGKDGLGANLDRFLHEHPTEILNASYAVGAGMLVKDGWKEIANAGKHVLPRAMNKAAFANVSSRFWLGGLVLAGALGGLLIKEDADAAGKVDPHSISSRVVGFFKEKPMRWSGSCYWMGNIFALKQAFDDKRVASSMPHAIKPHVFSFLTVAAYVVSNGLLSLSSRDQIREEKFKPEQLAQLEQVAAEIIAAQPPQVQAQLLNQAAFYLAQEKKISQSPEQIARDLIARVSESSKRHLASTSSATWIDKQTITNQEIAR